MNEMERKSWSEEWMEEFVVLGNEFVKEFGFEAGMESLGCRRRERTEKGKRLD